MTSCSCRNISVLEGHDTVALEEVRCPDKEEIKNFKKIMATETAANGPGANKTWELSLYELHRTPQEAVTDNTEIAVSPRSLHSELMCPICLDMLKNTMTTKECLHRFCQDCIITALRSGNKECPTCRKKLVSKRSLRPDPNFDALISKIYPSRDEYEAHQERVLAKLNKHHNSNALTQSINLGIQLQNQNRAQRVRKHNVQDSDNKSDSGREGAISNDPTPKKRQRTNSNESGVSGASANAPSEIVENVVGDTEAPNTNSVDPSGNTDEATNQANDPIDDTEGPQNDTEPEADVSTEQENPDGPVIADIEMVFKPHPDEPKSDDPSMFRYLKTSCNASVEHLSRYLAMRLALDDEADDPVEANRQAEESVYHIFIVSQPGTFTMIPMQMTLETINEKYWKTNKPLEMYYKLKRDDTPAPE
ncbi:unnamed protein product [Owenia fusiformis]|uniref:RING-type E3 ubiquitin transferase n=1 Tax=Owenia fusiformis TaxID=6347 RepID=A0A8S4PQT7_OWEFU|nr:unnamed protein product [Owenia fusiformis]